MTKFILEFSSEDMNNLNEAVLTHLYYLEQLKQDTLKEKNHDYSEIESIHDEMQQYFNLHKRLEHSITNNERVNNTRSDVLGRV